MIWAFAFAKSSCLLKVLGLVQCWISNHTAGRRGNKLIPCFILRQYSRNLLQFEKWSYFCTLYKQNRRIHALLEPLDLVMVHQLSLGIPLGIHAQHTGQLETWGTRLKTNSVKFSCKTLLPLAVSSYTYIKYYVGAFLHSVEKGKGWSPMKWKVSKTSKSTRYFETHL